MCCIVKVPPGRLRRAVRCHLSCVKQGCGVLPLPGFALCFTPRFAAFQSDDCHCHLRGLADDVLAAQLYLVPHV